MLEPISRGANQDVFGLNSVVASKFLDSYSMFDWGRMPDGIPFRGKFQAYSRAFLNLKIASQAEWENFLRSPDALAFRKAATSVLQSGAVTAHLNELADSFPMKTSDRGLISEASFQAGKMEPLKLTPEVIQQEESCYLLNEAYPEERPTPVSVMGKAVLDFSSWKKRSGTKKSFPFEFDCEFIEDFPRITLRSFQKSLSTVVSLTEALLITALTAEQLQELILRSAWIAGFIQFQLKTIRSIQERKAIRIQMGMNQESSVPEFVFLGVSVELLEMEAELQKYYSSTVWGKVVSELQQQARMKGFTDWKKHCSEPAPWLDPKLKNEFSMQYQKMISGIASCLSE